MYSIYMTSKRSYFDLWWPLGGQNWILIFLHHGCLNIGFLGQGFQKWCQFWIMTSCMSLIWPLWPLRGQNFKVSFIASWVSKYRFFVHRNSKMKSVFHFDLLEVKYWPLIYLIRSNFDLDDICFIGAYMLVLGM